MKVNTHTNRRVSVAACLAALSFVAALVYAPAFFSTSAVNRNIVPKEAVGYYDIRTDKAAVDKLARIRERSNRSAAAVADIRDRFVRGEAKLRGGVPSLKVEYGPDLHRPEVIGIGASQSKVPLVARANMRRAETLRNFARENSDLVGVNNAQADALREVADYTNPDGELSFATLEQHIDGVPVFQGEIKAGFNKRGEMFRVINDLAPGLDYSLVSRDFGDPSAALNAAAQNIKADPSAAGIAAKTTTDDDGLKVTFGDGEWATTAEKMYFPTEPGVAVPAWRVLIWQPAAAYYVIVDAHDGTILWRKNITSDQTQAATYNVYAATNNLAKSLDSPSPGNPSPVFPGGPDPAAVPTYQPEPVSRTSVTLIGNEAADGLTFNSLGWMTDNINGANGETQGNNVVAGLDLVAPDGVDQTVPGTGRVFSFNYTPGGVTGASVPPYTCCTDVGEAPTGADFRNGSVTNLFYLVNRYHDALYKVGFTEAARNFQNDNFGRGGSGNDRVSAEAQDSSGTNNANFSTPADGTRGRMQMYLFTNSTSPQRDGSLDAAIVFHEFSHGLSNRLIGNGSGLGSGQAAGMGEGWGDLVGFLLLSKPTDPVNRVYSSGGYTTYRGFSTLPTYTSNYYYGIRRFPYAIRSFTGGPSNRPHNPLTFADIDPAQMNLADGAYARSPLIGGSATEVHNQGELWAVTGIEVWSRIVARLGHDAGTLRTLQLYVDGMKLSPLNPTFLQERDALLAAAQASGNAADVVDIWAGFAARGMGFGAQNASGNSVIENFGLPNLTQTAPITITDTTGNNNNVPDPGELITLNIPFDNNTGQTATNVSFQLVGGGSANLASLPNGFQAIAQLQYSVPAAAQCGSVITLTINVNSDLGPFSIQRTIAVGTPVQTLGENFDSVTAPNLPAGWTSATTLGSLTFATVSNSSDTAPNSVYVLDPSAAAGGADLTSPSVAIASSAANLTFRHRFDTEAAWDGGLVEISIGGGPFIDIVAAGGTFLTNGYNSTMTAATSSGTYTANPLQSRSGWTGNSNGYITTAVRVPASAVGQSVRFKFRFGADSNTSGAGPNPGWNIDTVKVNGSYQCGVVNTTPKVPYDFDGDHKSDISIFRPSVGEWWYRKSSDGQTRAGQFGSSSDVITPGDFTGDGKTDLAFFRPAEGRWYVLRSDNDSYFAIQFGQAGDIPMPADFDGDGKTDAAVFRPSEGLWFILRSSDLGVTFAQFGTVGDQPVAADYDGDGKADIAIVRNISGNIRQWWIQRTTLGIAVLNFGVTGDITVPGDYTGDGKADVAVFHPNSGQTPSEWYILRSEDFSYFSFPWGQLGDVPVPADYDGDGKFEAGVFRPSDTVWYINQTTGGPLFTQFGLGTDKPVPSLYNR